MSESKGNFIPVSAVYRDIRRVVDELGERLTAEIVSERTGKRPDSVARWLRSVLGGERHVTSFWMVDEVFTALDLLVPWWERCRVDGSPFEEAA